MLYIFFCKNVFEKHFSKKLFEKTFRKTFRGRELAPGGRVGSYLPGPPEVPPGGPEGGREVAPTVPEVPPRTKLTEPIELPFGVVGGVYGLKMFLTKLFPVASDRPKIFSVPSCDSKF